MVNRRPFAAYVAIGASAISAAFAVTTIALDQPQPPLYLTGGGVVAALILSGILCWSLLRYKRLFMYAAVSWALSLAALALVITSFSDTSSSISVVAPVIASGVMILIMVGVFRKDRAR
jgi:peptidoglycan/LPS O-acetylase OafA/YrhL